MAMVRDESAFNDNLRQSWFGNLQGEGYDYMVEASITCEDPDAYSSVGKMFGVRAGHVQDDLRAIYNQQGKVDIVGIMELSTDFATAQRGGLELLPVKDVIAVERERAVEDYKKSIEPKPDTRSFWQRLCDGHPGF